MNHAGEIRALARIARPDWAVVSNVAEVHLEFFPDGIDGIARAKYELVESLPKDGLAFLNGDDERVAAFARGMGERAMLYGSGDHCTRCSVRAVAINEAGLDGTRFIVETHGAHASVQQAVHLRLMGRHNVSNALAAIGVGLQSGIALRECCTALEQMRPTAKRGEVIEWGGARLINDCYNSNPRALESMVDALGATAAGRRILVAGEMLELGPLAEQLHAECGKAAAKAGINVVVGVRGLAASLVAAAGAHGAEAIFLETPEQAGEWLRANLREGDAVLLKASRGVKLERAFDALQAERV